MAFLTTGGMLYHSSGLMIASASCLGVSLLARERLRSWLTVAVFLYFSFSLRVSLRPLDSSSMVFSSGFDYFDDTLTVAVESSLS